MSTDPLDPTPPALDGDGFHTVAAVLRYDQRDKVWYAELADDDGCHTFGRTHAKAVAYLRDAAALWYDVPIDTIRLDPIVTEGLPAGVTVDAVREARAVADAAALAANRAAVRFVDELTDAGYSRRDVASILGVSHGRVQQLLEAGA